MASGPQKSDIEAVFQRLRALPTNKVSGGLVPVYSQTNVFNNYLTDLLRLQCQKSNMGYSNLWCLYLHRLFGCTQKSWCASDIRSFNKLRHELDMVTIEGYAIRR